jgi:hypothetical protein
MACGNARASRGSTCALTPVVPPYIAPSMPTFACSRESTAPAATIPAYMSVLAPSLLRPAAAMRSSRASAASTRGSSWAASATTNVQPGSAVTARRTLWGSDSAPPPVLAQRPVTTPPTTYSIRNRPSGAQVSSQFQPLAV